MNDVTKVRSRDFGPVSRESALAFRGEVIDLLAGGELTRAVGAMSPTEDGFATSVRLLSTRHTEFLLGELRTCQAWSSEKWMIDGKDEVHLVSDALFDSSAPAERFSYSDTLRKVPKDALAIRALLSALKSEEVTSALTAAYGEPVSFRSADIARYRTGHYLRRHADNYDDRRFGMVFFLSGGWCIGDGGELIVEAPDGQAIVTRPEQGAVALLRIRPGYFHKVCRVLSDTWVRYSVAAHFGSAKTRAPL